MLNEEEINVEIARLEFEESSYPNYAKLADLYTIKNQMTGGGVARNYAEYDRGYSGAPDPGVVSVSGGSDFMQAVNGKPGQGAWAVMDELMDTLRVVNSRVYDGVMAKLRAL